MRCVGLVLKCPYMSVECGAMKPKSRTPKNTKKKLAPNAWIKAKLLEMGMTAVELGKQIGMSTTDLSKLVNGKRRLGIEDAIEISKALGLRLDEVLMRSGMDIGPVAATRGIELSGWVDDRFRVHWGQPKGPKTAVMVDGLPRGVEAIRFQTVGTPLEGLNGAVVYFQREKTARMDQGSIGRLCLVEKKLGDTNETVTMLRVPKRGYLPGRYSLYDMGGQIREEEKTLISMVPVLMLRF